MSEYPSYLIHYGTKGQKWGNRRYQNEDGSLTAEGKIRYRQGRLYDPSLKPHADKGDALIDRANKNRPDLPYYKQVSRAKRNAWGRFIGRDLILGSVQPIATAATKSILKSAADRTSSSLDEETIDRGVNRVSSFIGITYNVHNVGSLIRDYKSINAAAERHYNKSTSRKKRR